MAPKPWKEIPSSVYRATHRLDLNGEPVFISDITLAGSQFEGSTPEDNIAKATEVLQSFEFGQNPKKPKTLFIDLRILTSAKKTLIGGDERHVFETHTRAMSGAVAALNSENGDNISYLPIHQRAESRYDTYFANAAIGVAAVTTLGTAGALLYQHVHEQPNFSSDDQANALKIKVHDLFQTMPEGARGRCRPLYKKWLELHNDRDNSLNTILYLTLTHLLVTAINLCADTDTTVELIAGCKSAKDRTAAALAGMLSALEPLMLLRLKTKQNPLDLINWSGHFNWDGLSDDEQLFFKDNFDLRLLLVSNRHNTMTDTNVSFDLWLDFFQYVPFIATDCNPLLRRVRG